MEAILKNQCYYYLGKDNIEDEYHLFLMFPVEKKAGFTFEGPFEIGRCWSFTCENTDDSNDRVIHIGGHHFAVRRFKLSAGENKQEIVVHRYLSDDKYVYYEETAIPLDKEKYGGLGENNSQNEEEPDYHIAYNCPYVCLKKDIFFHSDNKSEGMRFYPRVIILTRDCDFREEDEIESKEEIEDMVDNAFATIIPLHKSGKSSRNVVAADLSVNQSKYIDRYRVNGQFEAVTVLFENEDNFNAFKGLGFQDKKELVRRPDIPVRGVIIPNPDSNVIIERPESKDADSIPSLGVFIDKVPSSTNV